MSGVRWEKFTDLFFCWGDIQFIIVVSFIVYYEKGQTIPIPILDIVVACRDINLYYISVESFLCFYFGFFRAGMETKEGNIKPKAKKEKISLCTILRRFLGVPGGWHVLNLLCFHMRMKMRIYFEGRIGNIIRFWVLCAF